jgi:hypothetical protein
VKTTSNLRAIFIFSLLSCIGASLSWSQTNLPVIVPESLSKLVNSRAEIERCITLATPDALMAAQAGLAQSRIISDDDKAVLGEMIRGVSLILYPPPPSTAAGAKSASQVKKSGGEDQPAFFIQSTLTTTQKADSLFLAQLVEASQGRIFASTDASTICLMAELLPSLAIFRTRDLDTARSALAYVERFEAASSNPSVIPSLVKARFALLTNDAGKAFSLYASLLAGHPDLWPARLGLGQISLGRNKPVDALGYLSPLLATRRNDPVFLAAYAFALYANGRLAEAEPFVLAALDFDPLAPDLAQAAAHINIDRNDFTKAAPYLEVLGKKRPGDRMYFHLKTIQLLGLARKDEAVKWARKAFQAYPTDPEMMILLADALLSGTDGAQPEAEALAEAARNCFAAAREGGAQANQPLPGTLAASMRSLAESEATRILLTAAYRRQDWFAAAALLDSGEKQRLDKTLVSTILRKSGRTSEAVDFAAKWYASSPASEPAAEAYLRSLAAASGARLASAGKPGVADSGPGILALASGSANLGIPGGQAELVSLVFSLLSTSNSAEMQSYLYYLRGSLLSDQDAAIDSYRAALLVRADNVEALAALAKAYAAKGDSQKALFYVRQARMIGLADKDLDAELLALEKSLTGK